MKIINGDNLQILKSLEGERFDLAELDGPYMAGLEGWDTLTEAEYIQHYAERLTALRPLLQPWGVVFVFGYPEGCAEIKSWAHKSNTLFCRRWIHWYNNQAAHAGRRVQVALFFDTGDELLKSFRKYLQQARKEKGETIGTVGIKLDIRAHIAQKNNGNMGGYLWFESDNSKRPNLDEYSKLKGYFSLPDEFDAIPYQSSYDGVTNFDFISVPVEKAEQLNDNGLRSKPVKLYISLFKPTIPPTEKRKALVLYGGSGNAAIAAEALGYEVTVIEQDLKRCELIEERNSRLVSMWREKLSQASFFQAEQPQPQQAEMGL